MRKATITLLIAVIGLTAWQSYSLWPVQPCTKPVLYSLGTFDKRFGMSQEVFISALKEAEDIWEKPLGQDLFAYDGAKGDLKVNLIYDYRQKATKDLSSIEK